MATPKSVFAHAQSYFVKMTNWFQKKFAAGRIFFRTTSDLVYDRLRVQNQTLTFGKPPVQKCLPIVVTTGYTSVTLSSDVSVRVFYVSMTIRCTYQESRNTVTE